MSMNDWGWSPERERDIGPAAGLRICRVIGQGRGLWLLTDGESARYAPVSGAFRYLAVLPSDYPVPGDFVAAREEGDALVIERVLPRTGVLSRKAAGRKVEEQILAANIDTVFLVFALDGGRGFHPRLLERLLSLVMESGAKPVVLLNKADIAEDREGSVEAAASAASGADVICTSTVTGENIDTLGALLEKGRTFFFLGKSGAGKSSLVNALSGNGDVRTGAVREGDLRGRHTTTSRDLYLLPGGAILVDSPGIREAALLGCEDGLDDAFHDIAELAEQCRFADCSHSGEPGCAVQEALVEGNLDYGRYESYLEFLREARYHARASDANAARRERLRWKQISKLQKQLKRDRDYGP